jgi:uncharacterized protein YndB with AHSA1/START domain
MEKEKITIEYVFDKVSINSLWNQLSTPGGLAEWFADEVIENGKNFSFYWDKHPSEAELIGINPLVYIRFRWLEEDENTYFEFRLHKIELTGGIMLEVTDFADQEEKEQTITLWDTQINRLKRRLGLKSNNIN